jgi:hypothetical protein
LTDIDPLKMMGITDIIILIMWLYALYQTFTTQDPLWLIAVGIIDLAFAFSMISRYFSHYVYLIHQSKKGVD